MYIRLLPFKALCEIGNAFDLTYVDQGKSQMWQWTGAEGNNTAWTVIYGLMKIHAHKSKITNCVTKAVLYSYVALLCIFAAVFVKDK